MKKKTLNEMFLAVNKIVLKEYGGGLDETAEKLNPTKVKAFLLNAKKEFAVVKMNLLGQSADVKKWAMQKIDQTDLFNVYEPNQKWGIASNLVLFVKGEPSPFDHFMPQLKEDNLSEEPTTFADRDTARDQDYVERNNADAALKQIVSKANEILQTHPLILRAHLRSLTINKITRADGWANKEVNGDWNLNIEFDDEYIAVYKNKISTTIHDHYSINKEGFYSILSIFHMLSEFYHIQFNNVLIRLKSHFGKQIVDDVNAKVDEYGRKSYSTYGRSGDPKIIILKYNTKCAETGVDLLAGTQALYYPQTKQFFSLDSNQYKEFGDWKADMDAGYDY